MPWSRMDWTARAKAVDERGREEDWRLEGEVDIERSMSTPAGTFPVVARVRLRLVRGDVEEQETVWCAPGFGPVRWRGAVEGRPLDAWIRERKTE